MPTFNPAWEHCNTSSHREYIFLKNLKKIHLNHQYFQFPSLLPVIEDDF